LFTVHIEQAKLPTSLPMFKSSIEPMNWCITAHIRYICWIFIARLPAI